jgi:ketosteroid isomerase-like protein
LTGSENSAPRAVQLGLRFVNALDEAQLDERTERLRELVNDDATWWIDTGRDRVAGQRGHDPGDERPWPLHGTMPMSEKLEFVKRIAPEIFPQGLGRRIVSRSFGNDDVALIEAEGNGMHASGKAYRNRYAFVIDVAGDRIQSVREYLDTLHADDVFGSERASKRTTAPMPTAASAAVARTDNEKLVMSLWPALAASDIDAFGACFHADGSWWTDSGTDRDRGDFDTHGGTANGYPLHGVITITEKLDYMRSRLHSGYSGASVDVTPIRLFSDGDFVALEAESFAKLSNERVYQNRYVFVVEMQGSRIKQVREYCDTLHVIDITTGRD